MKGIILKVSPEEETGPKDIVFFGGGSDGLQMPKVLAQWPTFIRDRRGELYLPTAKLDKEGLRIYALKGKEALL